ncbi:MAG TPA: multicopper oxidase domain-containing protein [Candidatus Limnocylindrales bacterium]|jgi:FtsP/CotA-like multicopper oxidase with cupredoxin domain|nr:multicopper oxidase domain-containing protein [Candidatus Limnocylindrales bacterium]
MSIFYLPPNASKRRQRDAEQARQNRAEILKAYSQGQVSRRDLLKWGLITSGGAIASIGGLSPFVAFGDGGSGSGGSSGSSTSSSIPTGMPASPLFGVQAFTTAMPRFDVVSRNPVSSLNPYPTAQANQTQQPLNPALVNGQSGLTGPIEGRPPGAIWAHQGFDKFPPQVAVEMTQGGATANSSYNPGVASNMNSGIDPTLPLPLKFHPGLPTQDSNSVWTFNGTIPPKLVIGRYGEPILFRHHNGLPFDVTQNNGFGRNTISTHEHNGHHGAENDGFTGAYFFPGQFYDYHWPIVLAGHFTVNTDATDPLACSPDDSGGTNKVPGDWHETMSTHWFHDHMFSFTSQNVYKGNAAMFNIYSGIDRGNETISDGINLRLPSGSAKSWGNLDYDVNLMLADKAWNSNGQLFMDIFNFTGFLGDAMTVNLTYKPYFEVEARKYRFRILNASVSRFFKVCLSDGSEMIQICNDGNLLPHPVKLTQLDEQGIAERYDIVIDFSRYSVGSKVWMVNLCEHQDGAKPAKDRTLSDALGGKSSDPCVGKFLEFRIVRKPAVSDQSQVPSTLIPNPDLSNVPVARERTFVFGSGASQNQSDPITSFITGSGGKPGPWGVQVDGGKMLNADFGRLSAAPKFGTREIWHLVNGGGGWDHPIHIHFEEGQILQRTVLGTDVGVPDWEKGRKDVYRLRPNGSVTLTMQFRDWGGMFMEHCHNTVHEDNAMLVRWELDDGGQPFLRPLPTPIPHPTGVTFENPDEIAPTAY